VLSLNFVDKEVLSIDSNKLEVLINTVSKLKEYNLCLKSLPERYFDLNICQDQSL